MNQLIPEALIACGGGNEKNKGRKDIPPPSPQSGTEIIADGSELFSRYRCFACHSLDGGTMYGPALNDLYGKEISDDEIESIVDYLVGL